MSSSEPFDPAGGRGEGAAGWAPPDPAAESPDRPSPARIYDYLLGGEYNLDVDRQAAEQLIAINGDAQPGAWANRGFVQRAVRWLAQDAGIDQIIDIGAGLPTAQNTHQIVGPGCRVVYVDNDAEVVRHGERLLADVPTAAYVRGDLRDPGLLRDPRLRGLIDLTRPVGFVIAGVLYFVPDEDGPYDAVARLLDAAPTGSYLALSHLITDRMPPANLEEVGDVYQRAANPLSMRTIDEVRRFFEGLEMVPPYAGARPTLDYIGAWGAEDPELADDDASRVFVAGVARKVAS